MNETMTAKQVLIFTVVIPIRTVSEANAHEHWRHRQKRAKQQRGLAIMYLHQKMKSVTPLPVRVTLTRISPRKLDSDNLCGALKHVRDGVAEFYGVDDGSDRYEWVYRQIKGAAAVDIEIEPMIADAIEGRT